jgi:hypothetical protein
MTSSPKFDPGGQPVFKAMAAIEGDCRKRYAKVEIFLYQILKWKAPIRKTGAQLPGGQQLPGAGGDQVADGVAGWNTSAKPSMQ